MLVNTQLEILFYINKYGQKNDTSVVSIYIPRAAEGEIPINRTEITGTDSTSNISLFCFNRSEEKRIVLSSYNYNGYGKDNTTDYVKVSNWVENTFDLEFTVTVADQFDKNYSPVVITFNKQNIVF